MSTSSQTSVETSAPATHHDVQPFFADKADVVQEILGRYPDYGKRSAVMPLLWEVQRAERYISEARLKEIAAIVEISPTEVKGVMSFYSTYHAEPVGKYHLQICSTLSCALAGSDEMYDFICEKTGLVNGETAKDGRFSIQKVECLGSCGSAPVLQVNDTYYENVGKTRCQQILESLGQDVMPDVEMARGGDNVALSENSSTTTKASSETAGKNTRASKASSKTTAKNTSAKKSSTRSKSKKTVSKTSSTKTASTSSSNEEAN